MLCREWHQISLTFLLVNCHDVTCGIFFDPFKNVSGKAFYLDGTSRDTIFWPQTEKLALLLYNSPSFTLTAEG